MKANKPLLMAEKRAGLKLWAGLLIVGVLFSCGRKMLPLPPHVNTPPAVTELKATLAAGQASLSWIIPGGLKQREKGLSEIRVFRADRNASCAECPLSYAPAARLSAWKMKDNGQGDLQGFYHQPVDEKERFSFYVIAYSKTGVAGPQSNIVELDGSSEER